MRSATVSAHGRIALGPPTWVGENPLANTVTGANVIVANEDDPGLLRLWATTRGDEALVAVGGAQATGSSGPAAVTVTPCGGFVLAANYGGGALSVNPIDSAGVGPASLVVNYSGGQSHPHQALLAQADGRDLVFVCDLGTDQVHVHSLDDLKSGDGAHHNLELPAGSGPRHAVFTGRHLVVACELDGTVRVVDWRTGKVVATQTASPGASSAGTTNHPSAIRMLPGKTNDGATVFVANRGPDTVSIFDWDAAAETLTFTGECPSGGATPWDMQFTHDGSHLLVANKDSNNLALLRYEPSQKTLRVADRAETPSPTSTTRGETPD